MPIKHTWSNVVPAEEEKDELNELLDEEEASNVDDQPNNIDFLQPSQAVFEQKKPVKKRRWIYYIIILIVGALLVNIFAKFYVSQKSTTNIGFGGIILQPKKMGLFQTVKNMIFHSDNILSGEQNDRINILILGIGGPGHDGAYLTDTNIIMSIKPQTKEVAMVSVPRDLLVKLDGYGFRKINNANAFGEMKETGAGGEYARQVFAETFNLDIPYFVRVDFKAFVDLVDAVGNITVNVPKSFIDNSYPGQNYSYKTVSFTAGTQEMNGEQALIYARSRHGNNGEGSDFARAMRQQIVIAALKDKFLSAGTYLNPLKVQKISESLSTHISTNLNLGQIMYLANIAKDVNRDKIKNLVLDNNPDGYLKSFISSDGAYVLAPKNGSFDEINQAVRDVFISTSTRTAQINDLSPTTTTTETTTFTASGNYQLANNKPAFPTAKIEILNGTWKVGLAARTKQSMEEQGFNIAYIGNCYKRPVATSTFYLLNASTSQDIITGLKRELNLEPTTTIPDWLKITYDDPLTASSEVGGKYRPDTDILILLGENVM